MAFAFLHFAESGLFWREQVALACTGDGCVSIDEMQNVTRQEADTAESMRCNAVRNRTSLFTDLIRDALSTCQAAIWLLAGSHSQFAGAGLMSQVSKSFNKGNIMKALKYTLLAACLAMPAVALSGCDETPADRQAKEVKEEGKKQADEVRNLSDEAAEDVTNATKHEAESIRNEAGKTITGAAKTESAEREADAIEKAGKEKADAIKEEGKADAKAIEKAAKEKAENIKNP